MTWTVTVGNKKMAGPCTSDPAQLEHNSHKLLRNLLAAILFPKSLDLFHVEVVDNALHSFGWDLFNVAKNEAIKVFKKDIITAYTILSFIQLVVFYR